MRLSIQVAYMGSGWDCAVGCGCFEQGGQWSCSCYGLNRCYSFELWAVPGTCFGWSELSWNFGSGWGKGGHCMQRARWL